jgi:hypothetical protein
VTTIDGYCREKLRNPLDVSKLDLQGYDLNALKGATNTLRQTTVVLVEVLFKEIYKGCPGFKDILDFMVDQEFRLYTLCGLHYGQRDELMWADAIFVKNESAH